MARFDRTGGKVGYVAAVTVAAVVTLMLPTTPAQGVHVTQVTTIAARAYALSASVPPILNIPAAPNPPVVAPPCPTDSADSFQGTGVDASPTLFVGALSARVDCPALPAPLPFAFPLAQADVANVTLLAGIAGVTPNALALQAVHAECSASPVGPVGKTTIGNLEIFGPPPGIDLANVPANTVLVIPLSGLGLGLPNVTVVLNEQFFVGGTLVVNGVHITTSSPILGIGPIDVVIAHVECAQILEALPHPPTTTIPDGPTTTGPGSPATTTTTPPGPIPTTTPFKPVLPSLPPGGLVEFAVPSPTIVVPFVPRPAVPSVLARTGDNAWNLLVLAAAAMMLGTFLRRASNSPPSPTLASPAVRHALARLARWPRRRPW